MEYSNGDEEKEDLILYVRKKDKECEICGNEHFIFFHRMVVETFIGQEIIHELHFCKVCEYCDESKAVRMALCLHSVN